MVETSIDRTINEPIGQKGAVCVNGKVYEAFLLNQPQAFDVAGYLSIYPDSQVYAVLTPLNTGEYIKAETGKPFSPKGGAELSTNYQFTEYGLFQLTPHSEGVKFENLSVVADHLGEYYLPRSNKALLLKGDKVHIGQEMETGLPKFIYGVPTETYGIAGRKVEEILILGREITNGNTHSPFLQLLLSNTAGLLNAWETIDKKDPNSVIYNHVVIMIKEALYDPRTLMDRYGFRWAYSRPVHYKA